MIVTATDCIKYGYAPRKTCDICKKQHHPSDSKKCGANDCSNQFCIECAVVYKNTVICPIKHAYVHIEDKNDTKAKELMLDYCDCKTYLDFEYTPDEIDSNMCSCGKYISI